MDEVQRLTKRELIEWLAGYGDDTEIDFGSTIAAVRLEFNRVKRRGENLACIELIERFPMPGKYVVTVNDDDTFGIKGPHLK